MQAYSATLFEPHLQSAFAFDVPGIGGVNLKLVEVSKEKASGPYTNFHLIFHGPMQFLPQSVYRANHAEMGEQELFIVPIGDLKNDQGFVTGYKYQSCFSVTSTPAAS